MIIVVVVVVVVVVKNMIMIKGEVHLRGVGTPHYVLILGESSACRVRSISEMS